MITSSTLISIILIFIMYIFVTFFMVPKMRKLLKIMIYVLVFIGLLFPVFEGIGNLKINLETYAIILAGIEAFEMIFKYIIEDRKNKGKIVFPVETMIGALTDYISTPNEKFQPMNANFGILPKLPEKIRDKQERYRKLSDRAISIMKGKIPNQEK